MSIPHESGTGATFWPEFAVISGPEILVFVFVRLQWMSFPLGSGSDARF